MRPNKLHKGGTLYWTIRLYDSDGALADADSTPTVAVRKNGASVADAVTVTKRASTTGIYDCSYNPASEITGDVFTMEETATITDPFSWSWSFTVVALPAEIAESVDDKLSTSHGAGAWEGGVGAGGGGPLPLVVALEDSAGDPLSGFIVYLLDAVTEEPLNKWLPTNDDGECQFNLLADDYTIAVLTRTGYQTPDNVTITLASPGEEVPIVIASQSASPADDADACSVSVTVRDQYASDESVASVTAVLTSSVLAGGAMIVNRAKSEETTDGSVFLTLYRGETYEITATIDGRSATITYTVPDAPTANATVTV